VARITLRQLLDHAAEHDYAVPAFNINNMEQGLAIMEAAEATDSPVIIQASRGARSYANDIMLARLIDALVEIYPYIPVCMHQDHGNGPATCATAIQYGFTSVMMDGSLEEDAKTPASYDYNVDVTRRVVEMAHSCGVSVEGELGVLGSLETGMGEAEDGHGFEGKLDHSALLTDPDQAVDFVRATHVEAAPVQEELPVVEEEPEPEFVSADVELVEPEVEPEPLVIPDPPADDGAIRVGRAANVTESDEAVYRKPSAKVLERSNAKPQKNDKAPRTSSQTS